MAPTMVLKYQGPNCAVLICIEVHSAVRGAEGAYRFGIAPFSLSLTLLFHLGCKVLCLCFLLNQCAIYPL